MNLGSIQIRLPAAVTVLAAGDTASGPVPPAACGSVYWAVGGAWGRPGVWQRSWQTSHGPRCGRNCVLSGSWPRRLLGQEENLKGCTGEDQVHPRRPERGDVKWGHRSLRHGLQASGSSPWGALLPGGLELERRYSWRRMLGVQKSVGRRKSVHVCMHVYTLHAHVPTRVHVFVCTCTCVHLCICGYVCMCACVCLYVDLGPERMSDSCNVTQSPGKWKRWQVRVPRY